MKQKLRDLREKHEQMFGLLLYVCMKDFCAYFITA